MASKPLTLTRGPVLKPLVLFSLPILISNIFQQLYNTVDTMIVGHFLGEKALAAVGASSALFDLLIGFSIGIANGMGIVIARAYGAKQTDQIKPLVASSLVISLGFSLFLACLGVWFSDDILAVLGTPTEVLGQASGYLGIIMLGMLVTYSYNLIAGLLRAIGDSLSALYFLVLAAILNMLLDLVFVTQFHLGIEGAALATVLAQAVSAVSSLIYLLRRRRLLVPGLADFRPSAARYLELLEQGLAMGLMSSIVGLGSVILQTAINQLGLVLISAQVTARRIMMFSIMPLTALASGLTTFVSQNFGAGQYQRIDKGVKQASLLALAWGLLASLFSYSLGEDLVGLISGSQDQSLITASTTYLKVCTPLFPILGCLFILRNSLQGMGRKQVPLLSSILELLGKIAFVLWVIPGLGYLGVIICEPLIWLPMTLVLYLAYRHTIKPLMTL